MGIPTRQLLGSALLERVRRRVTCHFLLILSPPRKRHTDMHAYLHAHDRHECIAVLHINIDVHTQAYSCSHEKLCFLSMAGILPGAVDAAAHSVEFLLNNILGGGVRRSRSSLRVYQARGQPGIHKTVSKTKLACFRKSYLDSEIPWPVPLPFKDCHIGSASWLTQIEILSLIGVQRNNE